MNQQSTVVDHAFVRGIVRRAVVPASLLLGACSADPVSLGDGLIGVDRSALASYAAIWDGYIEAAEFPSGSDQVRLALDANGNGTFSFGTGEPLPQPTDPDEAFPFERFAGLSNPDPYIDPMPTPIEAFAYSIAGARVEDERLRAGTFGTEVFDAACAIQVPVAVDPEWGQLQHGPEYSCLKEPSLSEGPPGTCQTSCVQEAGDPNCIGGWERVSCSKASLCSMICECTATACSAKATNEIWLDAALNGAGDRLEGTLVGIGTAQLGSARITVRLTRRAAP